ncbi:MAG: cation-translocating P-type ATPase [Planctomycetota bacterium]|jgi:calcium-translocating P-type ATPase
MHEEFHTLGTKETLQALGTSTTGLSSDEATSRMSRDGRNELAPPKATPKIIVLLRQFTGPLIAVLLAAVVVSLLLGESGDAAFIAGVLCFNALIGFFQEVKAESEIIRLYQLMRTTTRVLRDGQSIEIDAAEIVTGDIVMLESGARVPADMRVIDQNNATVDESLLTGESLPVAKQLEAIDDKKAIPAERRNMLFAGTTVARGRFTGVVSATGKQTELGEVASDVASTKRGKPPLVLRMEKLSKQVAFGTVVACLLVFGLGVARGFGVSDMFLMAVALAVAAIPEGLPVAITLTLAIGLKHMAKRAVLVRRLEAVEGLGSCTVICSDKTGTLTMNELTVTRIYTTTGEHAVSGAGYATDGEVENHSDPTVLALLKSGALANEGSISEDKISGDPTDIALLVAGAKANVKRAALLEETPEAAMLPFESETRLAACFCQDKSGVSVHVKGAPENVIELCTGSWEDGGVSPNLDRDKFQQQIELLSAQGLRVIAIARGSATDTTGIPSNLALLGLVGMHDAPRPEAATAVKACKEASVRVIVATGDMPLTAVAISSELGIVEASAKAITGRELDAMDDAAFDKTVNEISVFARVTPKHKMRLIQSLSRQGELVAMTGDGANDAGALKAAHVGVAMGKRGTDVSKEAARVVITDDNFSSIVAGIEEGRIVHDNVRNVVALLVMTGVGEVLAIFFCMVLGLPLPFTAVQLLWANLATEGLQVIGLAVEPGEPGVLARPPRPPDESIFNRVMVTRTLLVGFTIGLAIAGTFWYLTTQMGMSAFSAGNLSLLLLILIENIHIGNCRSELRSGFFNSPLRNPWLLGGAVLAQTIHLIAMHWTPTQKLLGLEPVDAGMWFAMLGVSLSVFVVVELHKLVLARSARPVAAKLQADG